MPAEPIHVELFVPPLEGEGEVVAAVSMDRYAAILAGFAEGLPAGEVLLHEGVEPRAWPAIESMWQDHLDADFDRGGTLLEELDRRMLLHRDRYTRPIPPLDEDLRAYLDFDRGWSAREDGETLLEAIGLRMTDLARLDAAWDARLEKSAELRATWTKLMGEEPGPFPVVPPPPPQSLRGPARDPIPPLPAEPAAPLADAPPPVFSDLEPELDLEQYASLCAELHAGVHPEEEVFARYGLADPGAREATSASFQRRFAEDPLSLERYRSLYHLATLVYRRHE